MPRRILGAALSALAAVALPPGIAASRVRAQVQAAKTIAIKPSADAYVSQDSPKSRYGSSSELRVDNSPVYVAYLRFDVPAGADLSTVRLRLYAINQSPNGGAVYRVWSVWDERKITWDNRPGLNAAMASVGPVPEDTWKEVDLTGQITGTGTLSMALATPHSDGSGYVSREGAPDLSPRLVLGRSPPLPPPPQGDPVVAAAGDIACAADDPTFNGGWGMSSSCRARATSDLLMSRSLSAVLTLGDNQYGGGTLEQFMQSYDKSWGRLKAITHPTIGGEYETPGAAGYFDYFGSAAGDRTRGYYSFDLGAWHLVALNSNCGEVGGCGSGSPQDVWLQADLQSHPNTCTLAYWHHPRWSSGPYGNNWSVSPFWWRLREYGADVVLNGDSHTYERFAPQNASEAYTPSGIREFVAGTGGDSLYGFGTIQPNSEFRSKSFGVLELTLHDASYDWRFLAVDGGVVDQGSGDCTA